MFPLQAREVCVEVPASLRATVEVAHLEAPSRHVILSLRRKREIVHGRHVNPPCTCPRPCRLLDLLLQMTVLEHYSLRSVLAVPGGQRRCRRLLLRRARRLCVDANQRRGSRHRCTGVGLVTTSAAVECLSPLSLSGSVTL